MWSEKCSVCSVCSQCLKLSFIWPCKSECQAGFSHQNADIFSKHRPSGPMLSISPNVRLSVRPSVRLCVCLFTFEVPFNGLFAPTSRSRMSNIFGDSESLGKSNGKSWSHIWPFLFENCLKSPRKTKKNFFTFFGLLRFSVFFNGLFAPTSRSRMSNIFRDSESLEKSNRKKWSQIWTFLFENCIKLPRKKKVFFFTFFGLLRFSVFFNGLFTPTSPNRMLLTTEKLSLISIFLKVKHWVSIA